MTAPKPYPDIEEAVADLLPLWYPELAGTGADFRVGSVFPDDLATKLPFVRVRDIGGNDDGLTDTPLIDIDVFHTSLRLAKEMARGIQARLLKGPHRVAITVGTPRVVVIDKVRTAMRPHDVPWDDPRIFRYYSSYNVSARR